MVGKLSVLLEQGARSHNERVSPQTSIFHGCWWGSTYMQSKVRHMKPHSPPIQGIWVPGFELQLVMGFCEGVEVEISRLARKKF